MADEKILIIGGVAAGMSAAAKAARTNPDVVVEVYTNEKDISYGACGLPYYISDEIDTERKLVARTVEQFKSQRVDVHMGYHGEKILPSLKSVMFTNLQTGQLEQRTYSKLIIATGASPFVPPIEGVELDNVFILRNLQQGISIKSFINDRNPQHAVIVGGGYIGLEMAESLLKTGAKVTIIELSPQLAPNMDRDMAAILEEYLVSRGLQIYTGEKVIKIEGQQVAEKVITDKREVPADLVLMAVGTVPNSTLAREAGIELGPNGAIRVNTKMETNLAEIYAAGDCATVRHRITGEDVYIPLGTTANKQGKVAGENAAGGKADFQGVLGTAIAKVLEMEIARTGLSIRECQRLGKNYVETVVQSRTLAHYYPGAAKIHIKLIADMDSRKLLGAQIVGGRGAGKRIDVFAACLHLGVTIDAIQDMDLAYAPPFSPVYDSILIALTDLQKKLC